MNCRLCLPNCGLIDVFGRQSLQDSSCPGRSRKEPGNERVLGGDRREVSILAAFVKSVYGRHRKSLAGSTRRTRLLPSVFVQRTPMLRLPWARPEHSQGGSAARPNGRTSANATQEVFRYGTAPRLETSRAHSGANQSRRRVASIPGLGSRLQWLFAKTQWLYSPAWMHWQG